MKQRVGIVGFGLLGQYLAKALLTDKNLSETKELAFVWNRSPSKILEYQDPPIPKELILENLADFESRKADLIVEVCHPQIIEEWAEKFLASAELMIGSPTSLANAALESRLREMSSDKSRNFGVYIPSGALWGAEDIEKMAQRGTLGKCSVTMKKHPSSLKLEGDLNERVQSYIQDQSNSAEFVVFDGTVRQLCPLAPNNVNTMACAALGAANLGFDGVRAVLVADKSLEAHVIDIEVEGKSTPGQKKEDIFHVFTRRYNPAKPGAVTGSATYVSFLSSLYRAGSRGRGFHFC
eukprot:TRINITY_DN8774_c0_g1_i1.p2 TRINITY_DN8774_c0_g1~~TRINITY_DN8774_c0_g1_i1.p2  ORF type:complete len:294 (-),score=122.47 TRINITY_DN8774_c0_g1_i1:72-953(-)